MIWHALSLSWLSLLLLFLLSFVPSSVISIIIRPLGSDAAAAIRAEILVIAVVNNRVIVVDSRLYIVVVLVIVIVI